MARRRGWRFVISIGILIISGDDSMADLRDTVGRDPEALKLAERVMAILSRGDPTKVEEALRAGDSARAAMLMGVSEEDLEREFGELKATAEALAQRYPELRERGLAF